MSHHPKHPHHHHIHIHQQHQQSEQRRKHSNQLSQQPPSIYSFTPSSSTTHFHFFFLLLVLFFSALFPITSSLPLSLSTSTHATVRDDVIGFYTLHPKSHLVASNRSCPLSLSFTSFDFAVTNRPGIVTSPSRFNIEIPHTSTSANGNPCNLTAGTKIPVVTWEHPYVTDPLAAVQSWAGAGNSKLILPWLKDDYDNFVNAVSNQSWIIGYDFSERLCRHIQIPPHSAYLWYQPDEPLSLANDKFTLFPVNKYLFLAFGREKKHRACIYVAQRVGGQRPYSVGPVSDPITGVLYTTRPNPTYEASIPIPSGVSPPPGFESPSPSLTPSPSVSPSTSVIPPTASASASPPLPSTVFDVIENDPNGPLDPTTANTSTSPNSTTSENSGGVCFPASAQLSLSDGRIITMSELQHGHSVRISDKVNSEIFLFSHRISPSSSTRKNQLYPFLKISAISAKVSIIISHDHYIHLSDSQLIAARDVRVGQHKLIIADGSTHVVTSIETVYEEGLYAPHTVHGDLLVNDVLVSTYTTAVHPWLAHHVLLAPLRFMYQRFGVLIPKSLQRWLDHGVPHLAKLMPRGPSQLQRFT